MSDPGRELDPELEAKLRATMKAELRRSIGALRKVVPAAARAERDARIAAYLASILEDRAVIASYVAMRGEADPRMASERAAERGATLVLPRVELASASIHWHRHEAGAPLAYGAFGIPEPAAEAERVAPDAIDLVLVPGVAFDERGHRIGQGKGFYDRALPAMPRALRVGVAYDFQLVAEVPDDPHDQRVDLVVTDARVIDLR